MTTKEETFLSSTELREEGAKELHQTLSVKHPSITIEECYDLYDQMIKHYEEHKGLRSTE